MGMSAIQKKGTHASVSLDADAIEKAIREAVAAKYPEYRGWFKSQTHWSHVKDGNQPSEVVVELFIADQT